MMENLLWKDFIKNKKNLMLKILLPFSIVLISYQYGFGNLALIMVMIFTINIGAGLKIVQLKTNGLYDRIIASPASNQRLFFEMICLFIIFYFIQFLPTFLLALYYTGIASFLFSLFSLIIIVLIGSLVGIHTKTFGQMHLQSIITVLPLAALTIIPFSLSYYFPFIYVSNSLYSLMGISSSLIVIIALYLILIIDISRF